MMKPQKTQCIEFYVGNGKGVTSACSILEYPTDPNPMQNDVDALYEGTAVRARFDRMSPLIHKETEGAK